MSDMGKINLYFKDFINEVKIINGNVGLEKEYTRGYLDCMQDILKEVSGPKGDEESDLVKMIKANIDMSSRSDIIGEIMVGLENLYSAYSKVENKE